ncbi:hypothetical protein C1H46_011399 [Malus baccata]|uniref:Uncharacterized protein n=1 Tax=Malus baccata TaxID=106549 RepID=A0A540MW57_MALBA|nr:hypothetical protein C1H46_011399 [Malus baccata]
MASASSECSIEINGTMTPLSANLCLCLLFSLPSSVAASICAARSPENRFCSTSSSMIRASRKAPVSHQLGRLIIWHWGLGIGDWGDWLLQEVVLIGAVRIHCFS